ncbi:hypothetical protein B0H12DRAFT_1070180 [Mycena haematopus]|nr:hypothetical protein B0H12DRAFT_1070180 [Mycena haematopus]
MAPRQTSSSNKKKSASTTRSATTRRARVSGRELAGLEADRGSPPRPSGSTIYNQSVSDDAEVSGDELESNSFSIPINTPGPLLKHSHPDSAFWLPFDNDESRRVAPNFLTYRARFSNPIPNVELFLWSTHAACYALQERYPTIFTQSVNTPAGHTYTNLSGYLGLAPDKGVKARLRTAASGPLFLLGSDYHIPAVQPPPKSAARSSAPTKRLAPVNDDSVMSLALGQPSNFPILLALL